MKATASGADSDGPIISGLLNLGEDMVRRDKSLSSLKLAHYSRAAVVGQTIVFANAENAGYAIGHELRQDFSRFKYKVSVRSDVGKVDSMQKARLQTQTTCVDCMAGAAARLALTPEGGGRCGCRPSDRGRIGRVIFKRQVASACTMATNVFVQSPNEPEKSSIDVLSTRLRICITSYGMFRKLYEMNASFAVFSRKKGKTEFSMKPLGNGIH
ncbi:MAG: hypothetical protein QM811_03790 [Pirellulales bacterium]